MIVDANCPFRGSGSIAPLLRSMDSAAIDKALLTASLEGAILPGSREPLSGVGNAELAAAVSAHPDRFIGCLHADPRDPDASRTVADYADRGFRAVKLVPGEGYYTDDARFYEFFDVVQDRGLAVLVACGQLTARFASTPARRRSLSSAWGLPMRLDAPSRLFPRIRWVIEHMGFPFLFEAWSVHHANKNVYLDISGSGPLFDGLPVGYAAVGGAAFIPLDFGKVVWGTDGAPDPAASRAVADAYLRHMGCRDEARRACAFGANAAALLGLPAAGLP